MGPAVCVGRAGEQSTEKLLVTGAYMAQGGGSGRSGAVDGTASSLSICASGRGEGFGIKISSGSAFA